jgi:ribosome biogenesis GTPase A
VSAVSTKNDVYQLILDIKQRIVKDKQEVDTMLKGKNVCLMVGITNVGKSTLSHALINGVNSLVKTNINISSKKPLIYNEKEMFEIGHKATSCTKTPGYYPLDKD